MSSKVCSPGAELLRNSRLMSLPRPITTPPTTNLKRQSNPLYPTLQAIATHDSSRARGDWGLKYDLPLKVSQKYLKYRELDTSEHRTTFETAHGEVQFVQKFREIGIPLTHSGLCRGHVFEEMDWIGDDGNPITLSDLETETPADSESLEAQQGMRRVKILTKTLPDDTKWRYLGPHLQFLSPAQLKRYILKKVKSRKEEFYAYVQEYQIRQHDHYPAPGYGELTEDGELKPIERKKIPVDINKLRSDPVKLEELITRFLDLPTSSAPPQTHPSAGLSYIRSAQLPNDPFTGPAPSLLKPIPGRPFGRRKEVALAGIAGVVAKVLYAGNANYAANGGDNREIVRYYTPEWVTVSTDGAVNLEVSAHQYPPSQEKPDIEAIREKQLQKLWEKQKAAAELSPPDMPKAASVVVEPPPPPSPPSPSPPPPREAIGIKESQITSEAVLPVDIPTSPFTDTATPEDEPTATQPPQHDVKEEREQAQMNSQKMRDAFANATEDILNMLEDTQAHGNATRGGLRGGFGASRFKGWKNRNN